MTREQVEKAVKIFNILWPEKKFTIGQNEDNPSQHSIFSEETLSTSQRVLVISIITEL